MSDGGESHRGGAISSGVAWKELGRAQPHRGQNAASQSALARRFSGSEPGVPLLGRVSWLHLPYISLWELEGSGNYPFNTTAKGILDKNHNQEK